MAQPPLHLIIGNYNTSSWSLRAWLTLRLARLAFIETRIPLRRPETAERIGQHSPSGKLPVLLAESVPIWDSLAIAEFIAELEPGIWPLDPIARAEARAISAEVHSGFADLRRLMPMDIVNRFAAPGRLPRGLTADIRRVITIWEHCRARFAAHGPFLFGAFSITDAMMAPIATRFVTHGVPLAGAVEDYVDSVMAWPDMVTWCDAAAAEVAEREAAGSLAVASITRPGRILGPEPAAARPTAPVVEEVAQAEVTARSASSEAAGPEVDEKGPAPATHADTLPDQAAPDETAPDRAATAPAEAALVPEPTAPEPEAASVSRPSEDDVAGEMLPPAPQPVEPEPEPAPPSEVPPPRRRLFEKAPVATDEPSLRHRTADAPPQPRVAPEPQVAANTAVDDRPAEQHQRPARRLGWLRHAVPADYLDGDERPYRRAAAEAPAVGDERCAESGRAASEETPAPRRAPDQPPAGHPPRPHGPAGPAIKPIGGGILRRR